MRRLPAPWVALGITLLLTLAATTIVANLIAARDRARFENVVRLTESQIRQRLQTYIAMLRAGDGFFAASISVDRDEFREYIDHVDIQGQYPGIQGIGFARRTERGQLLDLVEDARAGGLPHFTVHPSQPARDIYYPIVFLEPEDERNRAAIGYDMYSEPVRRQAMERARDEGAAAMSGRVQLVQELNDPDPQPGFLIYQPTYRTGPIPKTLAARRTMVAGFVYSPFRANDFFHAIFPTREERQIAFRVYDGMTADDGHLIYDSSPGARRTRPRPPGLRTDTLQVAGHVWTLQYEALPSFYRASTLPVVPMLALAGLLVGLLMFRVTRAQVTARARAEHTESMRARFFAAMSHELRTPINAILGYNDLLLSGVYGDLPAAQAHGIDRSQKAARHLAELVNDVLDLSKIEAGKLRLEFETVQVGEVITDLMTTIRPMAEERGSDLIVVPCACRDGIVTDPRRLRQILLNLLSNATKFGAGEPIRVRCSEAEDGGIAVDVIDRGPGIPPEHLEGIFEEFVQLDGPLREGTGLGLAISRRLAELLGGRLSASSKPGEGASFRLWLPDQPVA